MTGQKREWKEQVEGCAFIVEKLYERFPGLCIVFDGWTTPITPSARDEREIKLDESVANAIKKILISRDIDIPKYSVIGFNAVDKTAVARSIDFFISNHGTGSIHVARFAKKHGISHLSNRFMASHGHETIHHNTYNVPSKFITDLPGENVNRPDAISYSIHPQVIWNEFEKTFDNLSLGKIRK